MIQWGDLLRVPYTGLCLWGFGLSFLYGVDLYLLYSAAFAYTCETLYIYQFMFCFSFVGALLQGSVKLLSGSGQDPL